MQNYEFFFFFLDQIHIIQKLGNLEKSTQLRLGFDAPGCCCIRRAARFRNATATEYANAINVERRTRVLKNGV